MQYVYKIFACLVTSVSSYIQLCTVCSWYLIRACKMEQRSAIQFCVRIQKSFTETYSMIQQAFHDENTSRTTTYTWWKRFNNGRKSMGDDSSVTKGNQRVPSHPGLFAQGPEVIQFFSINY